MNATCPPKPRLDQFLAGGLASDEENAVEDHVENCGDCQRYLVGLTADTNFAEKLAAANAANFEIPESLRRRAAAEYQPEAATAGHGEPTGGKRSPLVGDPPNIPGYEVISVLGQGGLAVVYLGIHRQLRRNVALKVLRQQPLSDERERLRREAGALAGLHHPNIVQIHEAGEVDNRPFLVLEYVAGGSLARQIAGHPVPPKSAAKIVAAAASAIRAAHKQGLIHRDLKPANILLDWDGQSPSEDLGSCRPKLTDFGLVRDVTGASDLTHKRDLLGTPAYMAPEQAAGLNDVGPAADIWALGAVLYELLTGRPPFQGPTALDTLVQVRFSDPVPPTRLQPRIPRDIETICLKCLNKNPGDRYLSARELGDDLNRWLEGRPIAARRVTPWVRAWHWCRRNPLAATLAGVTTVLLAMLAIGGPIVAIQQTRLRTEATDRAAQAEAERKRAGANLELATQALDETIRQVYASLNVRPESIPDFDNSVVGPTVPYLEKLVSQEAATPEERMQRARAKRQLARALPVPRDAERCHELFMQAELELAALSQEYPARNDFKQELGISHFEFGRFLMTRGRQAAAGEAEIKRAIEIQESLLAANPSDTSTRVELGNSLSNLGENLARVVSRREDAKPYLAQALAIRKQLRHEHPKNIAYAMNESFTRLWLGRVLTDGGELSESIDVIREGIQLQRGIVAVKPEDPDLMFILAHHEQHLACNLAVTGRWEEAVPYFDTSAARYDRLAAAFPVAGKFSDAAVKSHLEYSRFCAKIQDWPAAIREASAALHIVNRFVADNPQNKLARAGAVAARCRLAEVQALGGLTTEATATAWQAREDAKALVITAIGDGNRIALAATFSEAGELILPIDPVAAIDFTDRAIAVMGQPKDQAQLSAMKLIRDKAQATRAKALSELGRSDETRKDVDRPPGVRRGID